MIYYTTFFMMIQNQTKRIKQIPPIVMSKKKRVTQMRKYNVDI